MEQTLEIKKTINYYEYVFQNSIQSDVKIILPNKTINTHKQVLGPQNPVFLDQFLSCPQLNKIEILDLNPNAVEIFIDYLYTGKISEGNITEDLFLVAHKYLDPTLKNVCREKLSETLSIKNATRRFLTFLECREDILIQATSFFIAENFNDVKCQLEFKQVLEKPEALSTVLDVFDYCKITVLTEDKNPTQKTLIDSANKSDLTIKVQTETFLAHKDILSSRNTVLETVISSLPDSKLSSSLNIPDFKSGIFKILLQFIYTRQVKDENISKELMYIAHKYVDARLQKICENFLVSKLCKANAIDLLILGIDVESQPLKEKASKFIADNLEVMKEQVTFQKVKENPVAVDSIFGRLTVKIDELYDSLNLLQNTDVYYNCEFVLQVPTIEEQTMDTEKFYMKNVPWHINIAINNVIKTTNDLYGNLGIYLVCDQKADSELKVNYSCKLISTVEKEHEISRAAATHVFSLKANTWGWPRFVTLSNLKDRKKGLMTNGKITVKLTAKFVD